MLTCLKIALGIFTRLFLSFLSFIYSAVQPHGCKSGNKIFYLALTLENRPMHRYGILRPKIQILKLFINFMKFLKKKKQIKAALEIFTQINYFHYTSILTDLFIYST